jgi:hypothetical protein
MPRYSNYGSLDNVMVDEGDVAFNRVNARLRPDQLKPGEIAYSSNGRMDLGGAWQPRKGITNFDTAITTNTAALRLPFYLYTNTTASSISRTGDDITIVFATAHPFVTATLARVSGITGLTPDPNGNRQITVIDATTIEITVVGLSGSIAGTAVVGAPRLEDDAVNAVYGSCLFSDPNTNNTEYIVIATNGFAYAIKLSDGSETPIDYPAGVSISADVGMLQAFDKVFIFRDGLTALEWNGVLTGTPAFTLVENGLYTQPAYLDDSNNTVISDGLVTVTQTAAHELSVGDRVYVIDKGSSGLVENGAGYVVAEVTSSTVFKFFAAVDDLGSHKVVYSRRISVGTGFSHMPAPPFAIYHQRRLWMPYLYTMAGSSGSPTITNRGITDEIIASDILDTNTYDQIYANYRIASGGADFVVAIQPFTEDNLVIFNRNTIHLVRGVSGDLAATVVQEITREVGCLARKSVVQVGNQILFLSDNGVYAMTFEDLYNLRGASIPLSESINPIIKQINPDYAKNAVAIYHDNRYYLSVPIGASIENNAILVYNFLTQGWESVDTVDTPNWNVRNFIRAGADSLNKLYAVNSFGGIHVIDDRDDDNDVIINQVSYPATPHDIVSYVTTRQYTAGTMDRKRYNSFELQLESSESNESDATISLETENPDSVEALDSVGTLLGEKLAVAEDASVRGRCNNVRGYGAQFTISPTQGRPKIRALKLTSQLTDLTISSKQ